MASLSLIAHSIVKNHNTVAVSGHPNPTHIPSVPGGHRNGVTPNCLPSKKATQKRLLNKGYLIKATQKRLLKKGYIFKKAT